MGTEIHDNPEQNKFEQENVKDVGCEENISTSEAVEILQSLYKGMKDSGNKTDAENDTENNTENNTEKNADAENNTGEKTEENESDKQLDEVNEVKEKKGGSYREVKKTSDGEKHEVHHVPADSASELERDDGPAIRMDKEDHRQTASCGNSREAREYRAIQKKLIEQGNFREAVQMDIDDIHDKFGDKYDEAIGEMMEYIDKLEQEGKING